MAAVFTVLAVVVLSLFVTKVGAVALSLTGLSREAARFQARSAFSGAGFTTSEAEAVVDHPVRRRVIAALILLGSAGLASGIATLLLTFTGADTSATLTRGGAIVGGLLILWQLSRSERVDRWLTVLIRHLIRRTSGLEVRDYAHLLQLREGWAVGELEVAEEDWVAGRALHDLDLPGEGIVVLGIHRTDGRWVGAPTGDATLHPGDVAVLYGPRKAMSGLDERLAGIAGEQEQARSREEFDDYKTRQEAEEHQAGRTEAQTGVDEPSPEGRAGSR